MRTNSRRYSWILLALLAAAFLPASTDAGTDQAPLPVNASVKDSCTCVLPPLHFGLIHHWGERNERWLVWIKCTLGTHYKLSVGSGRFKDTWGRGMDRRDGRRGHMRYKLLIERPGGNEDEIGDNDTDNTYPPAPSVRNTGTGGWQEFGMRGTFYNDPRYPSGDYHDSVKVTLHY